MRTSAEASLIGNQVVDGGATGGEIDKSRVASAPAQFCGEPRECQRRFGGAENVFAFLTPPLPRERRAVNQRRVDEKRARAEQDRLAGLPDDRARRHGRAGFDRRDDHARRW